MLYRDNESYYSYVTKSHSLTNVPNIVQYRYPKNEQQTVRNDSRAALYSSVSCIQ